MILSTRPVAAPGDSTGGPAARHRPRSATPLQAVKLTPPRSPATMVPRPRLAEALNAGTDRPVTLVSAGAGTGKSLAVAGWCAAADGRVPYAWLTLDPADNDPAVFWDDVRAALEGTGPLPVRTGHPDDRHGAGVAEPGAVRAAVSLLRRSVVLVLDDLHTVTDPDVLSEAGWLLEHPPAGLRLVLLARSDPGLPVHRLRVRDELTEIGAPELAFSAEEADDLFARHGVVLSTAQRDALLARTEGWVTGLQLAALALDPDDVDAGVAAFAGEQLPVVEYLVHEVLDHQPPELRDVLLRTSVVPTVTGALADTLTGRDDGRQLLERLARANSLIVPVGPARQWFRCHTLLREVLMRQLLLEDPALVPELHRRAARWFARHGAVLDAVRQAVHADDLELLGDSLVRIAVPELTSPNAEALAAAVRPMSARAQTEPTWQTLLCTIVCHYHDHDYDALASAVATARRLVPDQPGTAPSEIRTVLALWQVACSRMRGRHADVARRAASVLSGLRDRPDGRSSDAHHRLVARGNLGGSQLWLGRTHAAAENLATAAAQASQLGVELPQLNALAQLAVANAEDGALRLAAVRAGVAIRIAQRRDWLPEPQLVAAHLALALSALERGELAEVSGHLARALAAERGRFDPAAGIALRVAGIRLLVRQGDPRLALEELDRLDTDRATLPALLRDWISATGAEGLLATGNAAAVRDRLSRQENPTGRERVRLALAHLALGQSDEARQVVRPLRDAPDTRVVDVEARLVTVLVADRLRQDSSAMEALERALSLAEREGIIGPFHLVGDRIVELLRRRQRLASSPSLFVARILSTTPPDDHRVPTGAPPVQGLTDRELTVLRYLATMRSNDEIGDELHITVNTVKAHLKTLYRKLDVTSRREAVHRARDLDILRPIR
ncbi:MAG: LuxR C-terminal-related transcriptional regulator [Actinocatenispora sp.]